jgi:hypothetical protein
MIIYSCFYYEVCKLYSPFGLVHFELTELCKATRLPLYGRQQELI